VEAPFGAAFNVQAKAWTYLRSNGNGKGNGKSKSDSKGKSKSKSRAFDSVVRKVREQLRSG
jgi:hypothetical protein